jgi:beta-lactamase superfamily II metal-dependent hydrolase
MIWFSHLLARIPFADISVAYPFVWVTLVFAAVMCAVYFVFRGRGARAWICAVCVAAVALCGAAGQVMSQRGSVTLAVLSPGGSCCGSTVVCCGGHAAVFDLGGGGADKQDAQYIRAHNITAVDALILPVYDKNRVKLANSLLGDVKIKNIYIPGAYRSDENAMAKCVTGEGRMPLGGAELALLPSSDGRSLMAQLRYGNFSAVLTGPAKADTSDYGIASRPRGNIPVIFSGSMSQAFAMTFRPPDAVESGGAGAADAGAELRRLGSRIFDTRTLGNVTIRARSDGSYAIQS